MTEIGSISPETLDRIKTQDPERKLNLVEIAEVAAAGFGSPTKLISQDKVNEYLKDPELSMVFAELGRIAVDSNKTLANGSLTAPKVADHLQTAADVLSVTTLNPDYQKSPNIINAPQNGHQDFLVEGRRDYSKTIDAAAPLYPLDSKSFYDTGEKVLTNLYDSLPDNHPTKPLVGIEIQLRNEMYGKKVDRQFVINNYHELLDYTMDTNPDRAATVSAWLVGLGRRINDSEMEQFAFDNFSKLLKKNPDYGSMLKKEDKRKFKKWRDYVINLTSVSVSNRKKDSLRDKLQV